MNKWPKIHLKHTAHSFTRDSSLASGKHVHTAMQGGWERCDGGDAECPEWNLQLEEWVNATTEEA